MKTNKYPPISTHDGIYANGMADLIQAEFLFSRIPVHIRDSLSPDNRQEVLNAFLRIALERNSPIKFEATLPFFFRRYYLMIWCGRDRRKSTFATEHSRRELVPLAMRTFFYLSMLWIVLISFSFLVFVCLYLLKSLIGIDIFPGQHLGDFFDMFVEWIS